MAHILIVDDDASVRASLTRVLQAAGHEVSGAANGREAIRLSASTQPDVVVTDINMPEMDGIELLLALHEVRPGLPVIAISGGGRLEPELLLDSADLLGAVTSLAKPFEPEQLIAAVTDALERQGGD